MICEKCGNEIVPCHNKVNIHDNNKLLLFSLDIDTYCSYECHLDKVREYIDLASKLGKITRITCDDKVMNL